MIDDLGKHVKEATKSQLIIEFKLMNFSFCVLQIDETAKLKCGNTIITPNINYNQDIVL